MHQEAFDALLRSSVVEVVQRLLPEFYAEYFETQKLPSRGVPAAAGEILIGQTSASKR